MNYPVILGSSKLHVLLEYESFRRELMLFIETALEFLKEECHTTTMYRVEHEYVEDISNSQTICLYKNGLKYFEIAIDANHYITMFSDHRGILENAHEIVIIIRYLQEEIVRTRKISAEKEKQKEIELEEFLNEIRAVLDAQGVE